MRIILSDMLGFCFGVRRAIDLAEKALATGCRVSTLGSLVHNEQETARLAAAGIQQAETPEDITGDTVIIRAHGVRPDVMNALTARAQQVIDATCPFVAKSQRLARTFSEQGLTLVIIGHPDHPEVQGILGYFPGDGYVLSGASDVARLPDGIVPGIIAQTTVTEEMVQSVVQAIAARFPEYHLHDTVCSATRERQDAARRLAAQADIVYVIGGRQSSNTNRLAEICRQVCPRTRLIETAEEIDASELRDTDRVGITAGASTPAWLIETVIARLEELV